MLSVLLSSHNGGDDLKRMLDGLTRLREPRGGWRLIAVDNASTDDTGDIMRSYADRLPITVLHEPTPGKNRALNRALEAAEGDLYVFTDDDVVVGEDWLQQWREVADAQPDFAVFAGRTVPLWPYDPPQDLLTGVETGVLYAQHEDFIKEGPCEPWDVFGTNMAVRAFIFRNGVRFSVDIGPDGTPNYPMGSDTELSRRLHSDGFKCWFASGPLVRHIVPPAHLEPSWILRRGYRWGRGLARMGFPFHCSPDVLGRKNILKALVYPLLLPILPKQERWRRQWQFMVDRGYEDGTRDKLGRRPRWA